MRHAVGSGAGRTPGARVTESVRWEDRYQPYRRAPSKARRDERQRERSELARSRPGPGFTLHVFPNGEKPARRRLFLLVVLLGVTCWGAVSTRQGELGLDDLQKATVEVLEGLPLVAWEGRLVALRLRQGLARIF